MVSIKRKNKKMGFISIEIMIMAGLLFIFTAANVPKIMDTGIDTYEKIEENTKSLVYEKVDEGLDIFIDTSTGDSIHKDDIEEGEILPPEEGGDIEDGKAHVADITVQPKEVNLNIGQSVLIRYTLISTIPDVEISNKGVTWASDNKNIAQVSQDGTITAIAPGSATISVRTHDNNKTAYVQVVVNPIPSTDIDVNMDTIKLQAYSTYQVVATVKPAEATNQECIYSIEDESIALIDSTGLITAKNPPLDNYKTYVIIRNGNIEKRIPLEVEGKIIPSEDIVLQKDSYTVEMGRKVQVKASILPTDATVQSFNYYTQDAYYATVDGEGYITGQNEGQTYVDVCNPGADFFGKEICRSVLVNITPRVEPITGLTLRYDSPTIYAGESMTPKLTFSPTYTTQKALEWTTSNPDVITVDDNGIATAKKNGKATITATSLSNPTIKSSFTLDAIGYVIHPTSIRIKEQALQLIPGEKKQITVEVLPEDAADKSVTFTSTDSTVAAVDANGNVIGIREGSTIITARTNDGGLTASIVVTVQEIAVESVSFDINPNAQGIKYLKMDINELRAVGVTINPVNASNKTLSFTSSNPDAALYENGYVTSSNYGIADITVIAANGKTDVLTVEVVEQKPESIKAKVNPITIHVGEEGKIEPIISPESARNKNVVYNFTKNTTTIKNVTYSKVCKVDPDTGKDVCTSMKQETEEEVDIISMDEDGNIIGLNPGEAHIDITAEADLSVKTEVVVKVLPIKSEKIEITSDNPIHFEKVGQTSIIEATIYPTTTSNKELLFFAENNGVASVDETGTVTGLIPGESTITVVTADSAKYDADGNLLLGESVYTTVKVIIKDSHIKVTDLTTPEPGPFEMVIGSEKQLIAEIAPANATNKNLSWITSDPSVAVVNPTTGLVTAVGRGSAFVTVFHEEGFSIVYEINVYQEKITKFNVTPNELIMRLGAIEKFQIETIPTTIAPDAYIIEITDVDGNPSDVVSVDSATNTITALKEGKAYVNFDVPDYIENATGEDNFAINVTVFNDSVLWDGVTTEKPTIENGSCIIKSAANLAWVSEASNTILGCSTLDFQTDVNLNGHELNAIADKTNGISLNILGNDHVVENGVIVNTGLNAGFITNLTNENAFIRNFKLNELKIKTGDNIQNVGVLVGKSNGVNLDKVSIINNAIEMPETATPLNVGYVLGIVDTNKNLGISNLTTTYNYITNDLYTNAKSGGIVGSVKSDLMYLNNISSTRNVALSGEFTSSVTANNIKIVNFRVVNEASLYQSLLGEVNAKNTTLQNFYLALSYDDFADKEHTLISTSGTIENLTIDNAYYESSKQLPITSTVASDSKFINKTTEEMQTEEFVDLLNLPVEYIDWEFVVDDYPIINNFSSIEEITLLKDKLVLFAGVSSEVNVDTALISKPDSILVNKISCTSMDNTIVEVDEKTCVAKAGPNSGETKIRVTVNDTAYDDITVTSFVIGNEYGTPAALTPEIEMALVRDFAAELIEYELPTPDTWVARIAKVTMMSGSNFQSKIAAIKNTITEIEFVNEVPNLSSYTEGVDKFDVSQVQNGKVYAWVDGTKMYIAAKNKKPVEVNKNASNMFKDMTALTNIEFNNNFDTSNVTDMSWMFRNVSSLTNLDVSNLNTSNVMNMSYMFSNTPKLINLNVSNWDTGNVTNMSSMFMNASSLTGLDISKLDTSNVTDMSYMFRGAQSLIILDVSNWDTSNVTNMDSMFTNTFKLTSLDVSNWNTSNVTNMSYMFNNASSLTSLDVANWATGNVTNMNSIFMNTSSLASLDVANWNMHNVTNTYGMFGNATSLTNLDVSNWNTSNITNFSWMFNNIPSLTSLDVSNWVTSNATSMDGMFYGTNKLTNLNVSNWNTSSATNMGYMFYDAASLTSVKTLNWNTGNVTNMFAMFSGCKSLISITGLENWNTSNVTDISYMFDNAQKLTRIAGLENWDTSKVTKMYAMFRDTYSLSGNLKFKSVADLSKIINYTFMFKNAGRDSTGITVYPERAVGTTEDILDKMIATKEIGKVNRYQDYTITYNLDGGAAIGNPTVYNMESPTFTLNNPIKPGYTFLGWTGSNGLTPQTNISILKGSTGNKTYTANWELIATMMSGSDFQGKIASIKASITSIEFVSGISDLSTYVEGTTKFDISQEQNGAVYAWVDGTKMKIGAKNGRPVEVNKNASNMFKDMKVLTSIEFNNNFNTSNVTDMSYMFSYAINLNNIDVSNWNTSNVTSMYCMFYNASSLTNLDVSNWNTNNVTNMSFMFYYTSSLTSLDVSNWDTGNVTNMSGMFYNAYKLSGTFKFKSVDSLKQVTSYNNMFYNAGRDSTGITVYPERENGVSQDILDNMISTKNAGKIKRFIQEYNISYDLDGGVLGQSKIKPTIYGLSAIFEAGYNANVGQDVSSDYGAFYTDYIESTRNISYQVANITLNISTLSPHFTGQLDLDSLKGEMEILSAVDANNKPLEIKVGSRTDGSIIVNEKTNSLIVNLRLTCRYTLTGDKLLNISAIGNDTLITEYNSETPSFDLPVLTKPGYTFLGWSDSSSYLPNWIIDSKNDYIAVNGNDIINQSVGRPTGDEGIVNLSWNISNDKLLLFKLRNGTGNDTNLKIYKDNVLIEDYIIKYQNEEDIKLSLSKGNYKFELHAFNVDGATGEGPYFDSGMFDITCKDLYTTIPVGSTGNKTFTANWKVSKILFKVGKTTYSALEGMTWKEWIESNYQDGKFSIRGETVRYWVDPAYATSPKYVDNVTPSDVIITGKEYLIVDGGTN